jgi:hypothetical protein
MRHIAQEEIHFERHEAIMQAMERIKNAKRKMSVAAVAKESGVTRWFITNNHHYLYAEILNLDFEPMVDDGLLGRTIKGRYKDNPYARLRRVVISDDHKQGCAL